MNPLQLQGYQMGDRIGRNTMPSGSVAGRSAERTGRPDVNGCSVAAKKSSTPLMGSRGGGLHTVGGMGVEMEGTTAQQDEHRPLLRGRPGMHLPRLLDRTGPFHQSCGRYNVYKSYGKWRIYMYLNDWYHTLIDMPTWRVILVIFCAYFLAFFFFAVIYYFAPTRCRMPQDNFLRSFFFSVDTMMTIGYNVEDSGFHDCWFALTMVASQSVIGSIFDALCIGIVFERISRKQNRASTVLYSRDAVIRCVQGQLYFIFRICEVRRHQLSEAHVRLYASLRRSAASGDGRYMELQTYPMRLQHPDDELGAMLLLAFPTYVIHRIDSNSPLMPPDLRRRGPPRRRVVRTSGVSNAARDAEKKRPRAYPRGRDASTADDAADNNSGSHVTNQMNMSSSLLSVPIGQVPVAPPPQGHNARNILYMAAGTDGSGEAGRGEPYPPCWPPKAAVQRWIREAHIEVMCLVEGQECNSSGTVQARHSYIDHEICFDRMYSPCTVHDTRQQKYLIDFNWFHNTIPAPANGHSIWTNDSLSTAVATAGAPPN